MCFFFESYALASSLSQYILSYIHSLSEPPDLGNTFFAREKKEANERKLYEELESAKKRAMVEREAGRKRKRA